MYLQSLPHRMGRTKCLVIGAWKRLDVRSWSLDPSKHPIQELVKLKILYNGYPITEVHINRNLNAPKNNLQVP